MKRNDSPVDGDTLVVANCREDDLVGQVLKHQESDVVQNLQLDGEWRGMNKGGREGGRRNGRVSLLVAP